MRILIADSTGSPAGTRILSTTTLHLPTGYGQTGSAGTSSDAVNTISAAAISARSQHPGGVHVLMVDGSARFVRSSIALTVWRSLAARAGGEVIEGTSF